MSERQEISSEPPAIDLYMDKLRGFVRENRGGGNVIDVTTLLAVLLAEKEVRNFIVRQADVTERRVGTLANLMKENAENFIQRVMTAGSAPASGSGEIGFYHNLDTVNAGPQFVNRSREGDSAPRNMVEIFVALAVAPELAFTTGGEPHPSHSTHKALGELRLGELRDGLLEIEYGTSDPDRIFRTTPPREPTGKAIAFARSGKMIDEALAEERAQRKTNLMPTGQPPAPSV